MGQNNTYHPIVEAHFVTSGPEAGLLKDSPLARAHANQENCAFQKVTHVGDTLADSAARLQADESLQEQLAHDLRVRLAREAVRHCGGGGHPFKEAPELAEEQITVVARYAILPLVFLTHSEVDDTHAEADIRAAQAVVRSYDALRRDIARRNAQIARPHITENS